MASIHSNAILIRPPQQNPNQTRWLGYLENTVNRKPYTNCSKGLSNILSLNPREQLSVRNASWWTIRTSDKEIFEKGLASTDVGGIGKALAFPFFPTQWYQCCPISEVGQPWYHSHVCCSFITCCTCSNCSGLSSDKATSSAAMALHYKCRTVGLIPNCCSNMLMGTSCKNTCAIWMHIKEPHPKLLKFRAPSIASLIKIMKFRMQTTRITFFFYKVCWKSRAAKMMGYTRNGLLLVWNTGRGSASARLLLVSNFWSWGGHGQVTLMYGWSHSL